MTDSIQTNRIIPLFPLQLVQFPGALTPLHIFEPRYRKMLDDVMKSDKIFGIIYRNDEIMPDSELLPAGSVGCSVEVAVMQGLPDGRSNILCVGGMRYRLIRYIEGEPYLCAEVEFFEDDPFFDDLSDEISKAKGLFQRVLVAGRKLKNESEHEVSETPDLPDDAQSLSYIIAAYLDIEASEKQALLELSDTRERLGRVNQILDSLVVDYERRAFVHQIAVKNGHGGKLPRMD